MSDTDHTPGPWCTRSVSSSGAEVVARGALNVSVAWCGTASTHGINGSYVVGCDEAHANARLIAAASELLAVAKMVVDGRTDTTPDDLYEAAQMAIAIAEGKTDE